MTGDAYLDLEHAVAAWCRERPDILAAVVIGSRGRPAAEPDDHSDLDLLFFCLQSAIYRDSPSWLATFGEVWIAALNFVGPGDPEWMACFAPGLKADFLFVTVTEEQSLADMIAGLPYPQILTRGFRVLYQPESASPEPLVTSFQPAAVERPSESTFHQKINATLFTAERFVKFAIRNDAWRCRYTFEAELRRHLLALIEWHTRAAPDDDGDIWYEGRHLASWADERVVAAALKLDAGHTLRQQQVALLAFLDLLALLATETAAQLGYHFPTSGQRRMIDWLKETMAAAAL